MELSQVENMMMKENKILLDQLRSLDREEESEMKKLEVSFRKVQELIEFQKVQLLEELKTNFLDEKERIEQAFQASKQEQDSIGSCNELLSSLEGKNLNDEVKSDMLDAIKAQIQEIHSRPTKVIARKVKFEQKLEAGRSILNLIDHLGSITITTAGEVFSGGDENSASGRAESVDNEDSGIDATQVKIRAKPKFLTAISMRHSGGKMQQIYDITVMPSGVVVMTAHGSNVVVAARSDGNTYKVFSSLETDTAPKSIATISPYYVGVVGKCCIYIIGVTDKLILKKRVPTGKDYTAIAAYSDSSLILASQSPATVDFVGLNGFISETIDRDHTTNTVLFKEPQFITKSHEGVIYVTDSSSPQRVLSLNNAGKLRFKYPDENSPALSFPLGIACDSQGHAYVVDRGTRTVFLLTPTGEKVKDILTAEEGLTDPCAIAFDKNDNIYVTNDFNEVLIFQIR